MADSSKLKADSSKQIPKSTNMSILIADSGSTKCEWCLVTAGGRQHYVTQGISPYFLSVPEIKALLENELLPEIKPADISNIYFYGTGCKTSVNKQKVMKALQEVFATSAILIDTDMMGAARGLCGNSKGITCILGTGSSTCYYNGSKIAKQRTGLGYVLGDEGSGAYLGRKVLQYYLYKTFDGDLQYRFDKKFNTTEKDILQHIYKKPLPNRYLASFSIFLAENRGHYMIENIIEDGLNDFFFQHICKYRESWKLPVHFVGGVAFGFRDVIKDLCSTYELDLGNILKDPVDGLVKFHSEKSGS